MHEFDLNSQLYTYSELHHYHQLYVHNIFWFAKMARANSYHFNDIIMLSDEQTGCYVGVRNTETGNS